MESIIIVQADKSGKTVVMNNQEYREKIEEKLNGTTMHEEVKDPINMIKKKIKTLTNRLFKHNRINQNMKNEFPSIDDLPRKRNQPKINI
jgi:HKD family nuclease